MPCCGCLLRSTFVETLLHDSSCSVTSLGFGECSRFHRFRPELTTVLQAQEAGHLSAGRGLLEHTEALTPQFGFWIIHDCSEALNFRVFIKTLSFLHQKLLVAQLCLTLGNPLDCSLPAFSDHGIFMWRFLKKLEIELPYDPAIPLLDIHTEETRTERDMCTSKYHRSTVYNSQDIEAA